MKTAIIGSRSINGLDLEKYLPGDITLIVSGGARGVDTLAQQFADRRGISKLIFLPDYQKYGKTAPLVRNKLIVESADRVIAFWDGVSRGTKFTMDYAKAQSKEVIVHLFF